MVQNVIDSTGINLSNSVVGCVSVIGYSSYFIQEVKEGSRY